MKYEELYSAFVLRFGKENISPKDIWFMRMIAKDNN